MIGLSVAFQSLLIACALGLRHGLDPDHLAAVDGLTRRSIGEHGASGRFAGLCFSAGHGVVVVAAALAIAMATEAWRTPAWLEACGTGIAAAMLLGLAIANLHTALFTPATIAVAPRGLRTRLLRIRGASNHPVATALVGALFAISFDTIAVAAFFGALAGQLGSLLWSATAAVAFVAGMTAVDGLNGLWVARLMMRADAHALRASRTMTAAIGALSLALALLWLARATLPTMNPWLELHGVWLSGALIATLAVAFVTATRRAPAREAC